MQKLDTIFNIYIGVNQHFSRIRRILVISAEEIMGEASRDKCENFPATYLRKISCTWSKKGSNLKLLSNLWMWTGLANWLVRFGSAIGSLVPRRLVDFTEVFTGDNPFNLFAWNNSSTCSLFIERLDFQDNGYIYGIYTTSGGSHFVERCQTLSNMRILNFQTWFDSVLNSIYICYCYKYILILYSTA